MTERDPNSFEEVGFDISVNQTINQLSEGQPRKRSPRDGQAEHDKFDIKGSPDYNKEFHTSPFLNSSQEQPFLESGEQQNQNICQSEREKKKTLGKMSFKEEGIWLAFNKYLYTLILLFMSTFHFNLLGFFYFALFLVHTFAYYSFRLSNTPFDYLLSEDRAGKIDIRSFFCYFNAIVSCIAVIAVMVMKIMLHMSGQDQNPFDNQTQVSKEFNGSINFILMTKLIPDFDSLYTLFSTILAFLFSVVMVFTRNMEVAENVARQEHAKAVAQSFPFSNLHRQKKEDLLSDEAILTDENDENNIQSRKNALKRVSRSIQDYNFKHNILIGMSFFLLGITSASTLSWFNVPYQAIFIVQAFFVAFNFSNVWSKVQRFVSWTLLILLIVELLAQYALYIVSFSQNMTAKEKYLREVSGLLLNATSFTVFGIKIFLVIVESSRIQFQRDLKQLSFIPEARNLVINVCKKNFSFFEKLMTPISQFLFCTIAIIFALMHPSVIFVPLIPVTILAFFSDHKSKPCSVFSFSKGLFILLVMVFTCTLYLYNLVMLQKNTSLISKWRHEKQINQEWQYVWDIFGFGDTAKNQKSLVMRTLFPFHQEMIFILVLATCSKYADLRTQFLRLQEEKRLKKEQSMADSISNAYDEVLHEDGFSSSSTEHISDDKSAKSQQDESQVQADETLRGRFYHFFSICYGGLKWVLGKTLNFATIHSTKLAMFLLFFVTALDPNIFNGVLFIMFLAIQMGNNSQMILLWKFTLILISLLLFCQYSIQVFTPDNYLLTLRHREKNNVMCISGLLKCDDDDLFSQTFANLEYVNMKLYMPYYTLLLTFILGYFILTSENYQSLTNKYIDREVALQRRARDKAALEASLDASEISLDNDAEQRNLLSTNNSRELKEDKEEENESQDTQLRKLLKNSVLLCDPVTKLFIQYSLYLLIFAMALLSTTLPLALSNVLFLVVMTILVIRTLNAKTQIELYQSSRVLLYVIQFLALLSIAIRYGAQFYLMIQTNQRVADPTLTQQEESDFQHITALLFGYTSDLFVLRLLTLTCILIISNMQLVMIRNQVLIDIIAEADYIDTYRQQKQSICGQIKLYTVFTLYIILPVGLLGVIFFLVATSPSFLGLIAMFATVVILHRHQASFWKESYKTIGMFTQVFVAVTYSMDFFMYVISDYYPWFSQTKANPSYNFIMNSLHSNIEYFNNDQKFFTRIFWLYVILAFCFLQKRIYRYESFFVLQVAEKPHKSGQILLLSPKDESSQNDSDKISQAIDRKNNEEAYQRESLIYEYESCIRNCLWFKNEVAMVFGFTHGVTLTIVLCIVVMFVKLNITSLLYLVSLFFVYRVQYTPSRFKSTMDQPAYKAKKERVNRSLRSLIILCSVLILIEYTLITIHNFTKESPKDKSARLEVISSWENFVTNYLCYLPEWKNQKQPSQCMNDWNDWLEIGKKSISGSFFVSQYFLLMTAYLAKRFTSEASEGSVDVKILPEPVHGDTQDFTVTWSTESEESDAIPKFTNKFVYYSEKLLDYIVFNIFPYVLLLVIFCSVMKFDGLSFVDLIDCGFLIQAFWLLAYIKTFYGKNYRMLAFLRLYNLIVLCVLIVFQTPFFLCPVSQPTSLLDDSMLQTETFYIPAKVCKPQFGQRVTSRDTLLNIYVILAQSIGLKKYTEASQFPWNYILIVLFTEIQSTAFNHPYFQTYTLQEIRNQKLDGQMRGFMTVENYHLNCKWAYKAIKQQIQILHDRLLRVTKEYNKLINENVYWRTENYCKDSLDDQEDWQPLQLDNERGEDNFSHPQSSQISEADKSVAFARMKALEETLNDKQFIEMIEDIAMQLLRPSLPVISLKKLKNAVREAIMERQNSFLQWETEEVQEGQIPRIKKVDLEDLKELVYSLISPLQRAVYRDNKISLYNQDGVGLNFALLDGSHEHLDKGDDAFYYSVFIKNEQKNTLDEKLPLSFSSGANGVLNQSEDEKENDQFKVDDKKSCAASITSSNETIGEHVIPFHNGRNDKIYGKYESELVTDYPNGHQDALEINQDWKETIDVLREKEEEIYQPFMFRIANGFKRIILEFGTNRLIFYSLYDKTQIVKSNSTLEKVPMLILLQALFISQAENILFILFFINFAQGATLINLVLPISAFFYALLENPAPSYKYWRFIGVYILLTISAKLIIQLPLFCSSPAFGILECYEKTETTVALVQRIDFIIGLTKFSGPASYPKNIGILPGILWELIILIMLVNLKRYLVMTGQWHYVRPDRDIHCTPKFKSKYNQMTERELAAKQEERNFWQNVYPSMTGCEQMKVLLQRFGTVFRDFFFKLQPRYMERIQPNLDLRTQKTNSVNHFNPNKVKPGKDYFNGNFFTLLLIFFYTLIFYKSITGERISSEASAIVDLDHFTVTQVLLLLGLMLMMMLERMMYRTRKNNNWVTQPHLSGQSWDLAKHTLTFKLVLYVFLVIFVHIFIGFVMPARQGIKLSQNIALVINYLLWMSHFLYAALQLKHGYPQAPYKTTFMRDTSWYTVMLFRIYRALPFIWEMKVIIDWTVTHTCLDLFQWFRLDDAFNYVYFNKYQSDQRKRRYEYEERHWTEKFFVGFCFALGIIILILAPILLFSGMNPTMVGNPVKSGFIELRFELNDSGNEYSIFQSQAFNIRSLEPDEGKTLLNMFTPLDQEFQTIQLQRAQFTPYSNQNWVISTPSLERLVQDFEAQRTDEKAKFTLKSSWSFIRGMPTGKETVKGEVNVVLPLESMKIYTELIQSTPTKETQVAKLRIENLFPKMLRLDQTAESTLLEVQPKQVNGETPSSMHSVDLKLHRSRDGQLYWTFEFVGEENNKLDTALFTDKQTSVFGDDLVLVLYNESVMGSALISVMGMSVIGIYVTIVYAVGRFLRIIFDRYSERVIYEELPETGKLFEICEGIFIAQLEGDMVKEKRLYDLLIIVYRSPELMIKMTGAKQQYLKEPTESAVTSGPDSLLDTSIHGKEKIKNE